MGYSNTIKAVCRLSEIKDRTLVNGNCFVARAVSNSTDKYAMLVYGDDGVNNSDRVRSAFARQSGTKFNDTRCSRLKNAL